MHKLLILIALCLPAAIVGQTTPPIVLPPLPAPVSSSPAPVSPAPLTPIPVKDVQFSFTGTQLLAPEEMLALLKSKVGKPVSNQDLDDDVRAFYETGKIDAVKISKIEEPDGIVLRVEVDFPKQVGGIEFTGVSEDLMTELRPLLSIAVGGLADSFTCTKEVEAVQSFFNSKGYPEAQVSLAFDSMSQVGQFALKFAVTMGPRIMVRRIHLLGNRGFHTSALMPFIDQKENAPRLPQPAYDTAFDRLLHFYFEAGGYLGARIAPPILKETGEEGNFDLFLEIAEGSKYTIDEFAFSGVGRLLASELAELIELHQGDPYSVTIIEKAKSEIEAAYKKIGHFEAMVEVRWAPSSENKVSINFAVTEGDEFRFGKISIEGNDTTRDAVIRKELQFVPGDVIDMDAFERSMKNLAGLDYIASVEPHFADTENPREKDLLIKLSEKPSGMITYNAGYSSLDGFHLLLGLKQTNFDPFNYPNFNGGGVKFSMDMDFASRGGHLRLSIGRRDFLGRSLRLKLPKVESPIETSKGESQPTKDSEIISPNSEGERKP